MALQVPQNASANLPQVASSQVNPAQQFGHVVEQQAGAPAIPANAQGTAYDTGAIIGNAMDGLANVITNAGAKVRALKAAEEHATLQNDMLDLQQKSSDERKNSAELAAKEGWSIDEQKSDYERRMDNIFSEYSADRFSDNDIRQTASVRLKEFQMRNAQDYEERVVAPGRVQAIRRITDRSEADYLRFLEANPDTTAEEADRTKSQLAELMNSPFAISTLGPDAAQQRTFQMYSNVDKRLVDNKIESIAKSGIENSNTLEEAQQSAEAQRQAGYAAIDSRPHLTADQQDKAKDRLDKTISQLMTRTESNLRAKENEARIKIVAETEHKTFEVTQGLRTGRTSIGGAVSYMQKQHSLAEAAISNGHEKIAQYHWRQADTVQRAIDTSSLRNEMRASREAVRMKPLLNAQARLNAHQVISDPAEINAVAEAVTKNIPVTDTTAILTAISPYTSQMHTLPAVAVRAIYANTKSQDANRQQYGLTQLDMFLKAKPEHINQFDTETQRSIEDFRRGYPVAVINKRRDQEAKVPLDVREARQHEFAAANKDNKAVTSYLKKKFDVGDKGISTEQRAAYTTAVKHEYALTGDLEGSLNVAFNNYSEVNGVSEYGPTKTVVSNPPEKRVPDQEGFKRQLEWELSGYKDEEGRRAPLTTKDVVLQYNGDIKGVPRYKILVTDPISGAKVKPIGDFVFSPEIEAKHREGIAGENIEKVRQQREADKAAKAERAAKQKEKLEQQQAINPSRTVPERAPVAAPKRKTLLTSDQVLPFGK